MLRRLNVSHWTRGFSDQIGLGYRIPKILGGDVESNGAREAVIRWLEGPPIADPELPDFSIVSADNLMAYLWLEGFKIVPLEPRELQ